MKIDVLIELINSRYETTITVARVSSAEQDKINQFGEPLIEVGGQITGSATRPTESPTDVDFTLPASQRRMISDFPVKQIFDLADTADADLYAKVWSDTVRDRMSTAVTNLLTVTSPFAGETGYTLPFVP